MFRLRRSEILLIAYFTYTAALSLFFPLPRRVTAITVGLNTLVVCGFLLAAYADSFRHGKLLAVLRDWYPAPLMLLAYREMGWFAQPRTSFETEQAWVVWDRMVLNDWGARAFIEAFGPALPSLLEIAYSLVYVTAPFSMAMLYVYGKRERMDRFLMVFLLAILSAYSLFPLFPSEPPRTVFPGQDLPSFDTVFRRFNLRLLGSYGIHTSVFPSAHVSGAFAAAFAMMRLLPEKQWVGLVLLGTAALIATATVYGRYHYLVDALAGLAISGLAGGLGRLLDRSGFFSVGRSRRT